MTRRAAAARPPVGAGSVAHTEAAQEFQAHRRFLWGLCYRMTGRAPDADDVVQETFVRALQRPPRSDAGGWKAWLARVATNLSIDLLRRRRRREYTGPWLPTPIETGDEAAPPGHEVVDRGESTEYRYDLMESVSLAFLLALERLTPRQRAVLLLRDVFDYSVKETAAALALTQANVKVTHHRARKLMGDYDAARTTPTRERQVATGAKLAQFLTHLQNQDVAAVEAMLAADARFVSDGGGEFTAATNPISGRDKVCRLLLGLTSKMGRLLRSEVRMLNGGPALLAEIEARPGIAPTWVFQVRLDAAGDIRDVHVVLASAKLVALSAFGGAAPGRDATAAREG